MTNQLVLINRDHPGTTILSLNRPEKRNALNIPLLRDLCEAIRETHALPDQRALIISGEGNVFSAGLDLKESLDGAGAEPSARMIEKLLRSLYESPLVTIAAVRGAAIAGGAGIVAACDLAVAAEGTSFAFPEVKRGLVAALVSTLLKRQLSGKHLRELMLLGEPIDADRAYDIGLINAVCEEKELLNKALRYAEQAKKAAPSAVLETKRLLENLNPRSLKESMQIAMQTHKQARTHIEAQEGIAAFLEGREPRWGIE